MGRYDSRRYENVPMNDDDDDDDAESGCTSLDYDETDCSHYDDSTYGAQSTIISESNNNMTYGRLFCLGCRNNNRSSSRVKRNPRRFISAQHEIKSLKKKRKKLDALELDFEQERRNGFFLLIACAMMMVICAILFLDQIYPAPPKIIYVTNTTNSNHKSSSSSSEKNTVTDSSSTDNKHHTVDESSKDKKNTDKKNKNSIPDISDNYKEELEVMDKIETRIEKLSLYEPWNIPYKPSRGIPLYWHIPNSGSLTIDEVLSHCVHLVQATDDIFVVKNHENEEALDTFTHHDGAKYVNVNLGTPDGIKRAKQLRLVSSGKADVIRTSYIYDAATLFESSSRRGKCFTLLRDPVERAITVYNILHESGDPTFKSMSLEEYARSKYCEENYMVRHLAKEMEKPLDWHHMELAKEVLGRKCIVGFSDQFHESLRRIEKYFGWDIRNDPESRIKCEQNIFKSTKDAGLVQIEGVSDKVRELFQAKNVYDIELYNFAKDLFKKQALYGQ